MELDSVDSPSSTFDSVVVQRKELYNSMTAEERYGSLNSKKLTDSRSDINSHDESLLTMTDTLGDVELSRIMRTRMLTLLWDLRQKSCFYFLLLGESSQTTCTTDDTLANSRTSRLELLTQKGLFHYGSKHYCEPRL